MVSIAKRYVFKRREIMNIKEKIKSLQKSYNDLVAKRSKILKDTENIEEPGKIKETRSNVAKMNDQIDNVKSEIDDWQALLEEEERSFKPFAGKNNKVKAETVTSKEKIRSAVNKYIHTRDASDAAAIGIKSSDAGVTIPDTTQYIPQEEVKTVPDLSQYVTKFNVTTPTGQYPIFKHANSVLNTVDELEKNPDLKKPEFLKVNWSVDTYRGAIPLSQESIDDSQADLMGIVATNARETKINTSNAKIVEQFKTFTPQSLNQANYIDDIKYILNVGLDWAYNKVIICSASFYNILDTMKDKNGHYLWDEPWINGGANVLKATTVQAVPDEVFGEKGTAQAFIGDSKRAVLMPNRLDTQVRWVDSEVYGQYLQAVARMGFAKADENAGFFVTAGSTASTSGKSSK